MGKQGPCFHCGIRDTPLWRNGPPEKPVLCNACGSRYRLRRNLEGYIPSHIKFRAQNTGRRNLNINEPTSNVVTSSSSSSSNILTSDSAFQGIDTSSWKSSIPSGKRSRLVYQERKLSMEKFQSQLLNLWETQKSENESSPEEEVLLYNQNPLIPSNEIGLGCVLLHPDLTNKCDHEHKAV